MRRALLTALLACAGGAALSAAEPVLRAVVRDTRGDAVPDAVVSLHALAGGPVRSQPPARPVEILQQGQEYSPYVTAVVAGTTVEFPNRDDIQHHIYSLSKAKRFEKPLYGPGARESVVFDQPGIVTLGCNIHDWMVAYVVVLPTPHFAKTGADGAAAVGAPAGRYRLEVWHPRLAAVQAREVTVLDGENPAQEFSLKLKPDRRLRRAPESRTGGY